MGTVEHDELKRDAQDARNEEVWAVWEEKAREYLLVECFEQRVDTLLDILKDDVEYWINKSGLKKGWKYFKIACSEQDQIDMGESIDMALEAIARHWISTEDGQRRLNEIIWELEREARG